MSNENHEQNSIFTSFSKNIENTPHLEEATKRAEELSKKLKTLIQEKKYPEAIIELLEMKKLFEKNLSSNEEFQIGIIKTNCKIADCYDEMGKIKQAFSHADQVISHLAAIRSVVIDHNTLEEMLTTLTKIFEKQPSEQKNRKLAYLHHELAIRTPNSEHMQQALMHAEKIANPNETDNRLHFQILFRIGRANEDKTALINAKNVYTKWQEKTNDDRYFYISCLERLADLHAQTNYVKEAVLHYQLAIVQIKAKITNAKAEQSDWNTWVSLLHKIATIYADEKYKGATFSYLAKEFNSFQEKFNEAKPFIIFSDDPTGMRIEFIAITLIEHTQPVSSIASLIRNSPIMATPQDELQTPSNDNNCGA